MASALLEMALSPFRPSLTRSASSDTSDSARSVEASSDVRYSNSSTPPTSATYSESVASAAAKLDHAHDIDLDSGPQSDATQTLSQSAPSIHLRRPQDSHLETYNSEILSETSGHAPRRFLKPSAKEPKILTRRKTIPSHPQTEIWGGATERMHRSSNRLDAPDVGAPSVSNFHSSSKKHTKLWNRVEIETTGCPRRCKASHTTAALSARRTTRSVHEPIESPATKLNVLGKKARNDREDPPIGTRRELRRLADTNEFAKIDTQPVVTEVWSNGKLVTGQESPTKRLKSESTTSIKVDGSKKATEKAKSSSKGAKVWLNKGLYAGQATRNLDWFAGQTKDKRKKTVNTSDTKTNGLLPLPMWHGQRLLHIGRDFKLPFDVCSPLPPGQPKPNEWRKVPKNRFVGDAAVAWKKSTVFDDFSSRCVCSPRNSCDESCQNRIMLYECDDGNCSAGREHCTNRSFADLQERRGKGGKYRIGVEVIKTSDRGYGVRSNRCFDPHQIIVEYTGEIITEEECDRRMNEVYKDNECYYLMLFDQNMIIDATRGSIARFVNHSCEPNCRMVKWIVAGKPRMALFAGDHPIMTGVELTYDYNFDPFSAKNVQQCRCGSENCRGVLGPRPKDKAKVSCIIAETNTNAVSTRKRKLQDLLIGENIVKSPKKRKNFATAPPPSSLKNLSSARGFNLNMPNTASTIIASKPDHVSRGSARAKPVRTYSSKSVGLRKLPLLASSRKLACVKTIPGKAKGKNNAQDEPIFMTGSGTERSAATVSRGTRKRTPSSKRREIHRSKATALGFFSKGMTL